MGYDPGSFDHTENRVEPVGVNPFVSRVLPMSPERTPAAPDLDSGISGSSICRVLNWTGYEENNLPYKDYQY